MAQHWRQELCPHSPFGLVARVSATHERDQTVAGPPQSATRSFAGSGSQTDPQPPWYNGRAWGEQCVYSSGAHCISIRMMRMCALECVCVCARARASVCMHACECLRGFVGCRCVTKCVCADVRLYACMYQRLCICVCSHVLLCICVCSCVYVCM